MAGFIGAINEVIINGRESFINWQERLENFFVANNIDAPEKKRAVFLTMCGADMYQLVRSLTSPGKPNDKTYDQLTLLLKNHLNPKPNVIVERYKFNIRTRKQAEAVSSFITELRRLSRDCEYNDAGNDMIRDRLVVGINDINIQRKLLSEVNLTLEKATNIAIGMETANRVAAEMSTAMSTQH